jgi:hypothetical protein
MLNWVHINKKPITNTVSKTLHMVLYVLYSTWQSNQCSLATIFHPNQSASVLRYWLAHGPIYSTFVKPITLCTPYIKLYSPHCRAPQIHLVQGVNKTVLLIIYCKRQWGRNTLLFGCRNQTNNQSLQWAKETFKFKLFHQFGNLSQTVRDSMLNNITRFKQAAFTIPNTTIDVYH